MIPVNGRLKLMMDLGELLLMVAEEAARQARKHLTPKRRGSYKTLRPGEETLMWNAFAALLREALEPYGSKVRLARYLGIPKQRLTDFLSGRSRMPDAEVTLQMLNWLVRKRAGRDLSL